jgi:hypothetical protein
VIAKARCSSCHCVDNLVITDADSPAAEPQRDLFERDYVYV